MASDARKAAEPLKPGESRMLDPTPCPPDWYHHPNEYYLLQRAAFRLIERNARSFWKNPEYIDNTLEAFQLIRSLAETMPSRPIEAWVRDGHNIRREICCPGCEHIFIERGMFYVPRCPNCQAFLAQRLTEISTGGAAIRAMKGE